MSDVATMEAGPEMDRLVAERVMGLMTRANDDGVSAGWVPDESGGGRYVMLPAYSTDIANAWEVVERMIGLGWAADIDVNVEGTECTFDDEGHNERHGRFAYGCAETPALAICRAALSACAS